MLVQVGWTFALLTARASQFVSFGGDAPFLACLDRFVSPFPLHHGQGGFPWDGGLLFQGEGRGVDHALKLSSGRKPPPFAADPAIAW